jgi:hypothetical protein
MVELGATGRRQPVALGGPPASHLLPGRGGHGLGVTSVDQRVQMPAHTRRREAQPFTDLTGGNGSGFQEQTHDGASGVTVGSRSRCCGDSSIQLGSDFHNTSVTQFRQTVQQGCPTNCVALVTARPANHAASLL